MTGRVDIDAEPIGRIAEPFWLATKANPSKDGDAKLQGYRTQTRVMLAVPPSEIG